MNMTMSVRTLVALCMAGIAAAGAGCGSVIESRPRGGAPSTPQERDAQFAIPMEAYNNLGYRMDWRGFPVVSPNYAIRELQIYPDAIVVQETGSNVTLMEPANGSVRWSNGLATKLVKFVSVARVSEPRYGDTIAIASESEVFLLSTQTGTLVARQPFERVATTGTVVAGGLGIYGTASGELVCHQYASGAKLWGVDAQGSFDQPPVALGPTTVGAVTTTGRVVFVDLAAGGLIGKASIFDGPGSPPASNGTTMFVASVDQSLYAILPNGAQLWRHRTADPLHWAPACSGEAVYCTTSEGLTAFDAGSGSVLWTAADAHGNVIGKRKNNLMVWDGTTMYLVDQQRGDIMGQETLPDVRFIKLSAFDDGDMYVVSKSGVIAKFVTR